MGTLGALRVKELNALEYIYPVRVYSTQQGRWKIVSTQVNTDNSKKSNIVLKKTSCRKVHIL